MHAFCFSMLRMMPMRAYSLTDLRARDPRREQARIGPLYDTLSLMNGERGIGFTVFGNVVDKNYLARVVVGLWTVFSVLGPIIIDNVAVTMPANSGARMALCDYGWVKDATSGRCYRMWTEAPVAWTEALSMCRQHGAELAKIESDSQDSIVRALVASAEAQHGGSTKWAQIVHVDGAWIGLSDRTSEASFYWSDGDALHQDTYTNWFSDQPDNGDQEGSCDQGSGDDCVLMSTMGWQDEGCTTMGGKAGEPGELHGVSGCYPAERGFVCSYDAQPTVASGGTMLGCKGGGWVMGRPHSNSSLPPTAVYRGVYPPQLVNSSMAKTRTLSQSLHSTPTPAHCVGLVRHLYPTADAAVFSNVGEVWCSAAWGARGVFFDPTTQSCLFE